MVTDDGPHHHGSLDGTDACIVTSTDEAHQSTPDGAYEGAHRTRARRQLQLVAHAVGARRRDCTSMVRPMVRVMVRTRRLIQRDTVSRTTMRVSIPTHPGANLCRWTVEMGALVVIIAVESPRRRMRTTPAGGASRSPHQSAHIHSMVRVRSTPL